MDCVASPVLAVQNESGISHSSFDQLLLYISYLNDVVEYIMGLGRNLLTEVDRDVQ